MWKQRGREAARPRHIQKEPGIQEAWDRGQVRTVRAQAICGSRASSVEMRRAKVGMGKELRLSLCQIGTFGGLIEDLGRAGS